MGFGRRGKTSFTVHRSEEVLPGDVRLSKQGSSASSDGEGSIDGDRCIKLIIHPTPTPNLTRPRRAKHVDRYIERYL